MLPFVRQKSQNWVVYKIACDEWDEVYIGSTSNFDRRVNEHFDALRDGTHANHAFQGAYDQGSAFVAEVIDRCVSKEHAIWCEQLRINEARVINRRVYNAVNPVSEERRRIVGGVVRWQLELAAASIQRLIRQMPGTE